MNFKINLLTKAIAVCFLSGIVLSSFTAFAAQAKSKDVKIKHSVASKEDCIVADKACLLEVNPVLTSHGDRSFNVTQVCDPDYSQIHYLYKLPMKEQITQRLFLGQSLCKGVVSISDMELPFSKASNGAQDANDGLLLVNEAEAGIKDILSLLSNMENLAAKAATGTYTSLQLSDMNTEFQDFLNEVNRVANVTSFNGIGLLVGMPETVEVLVNKGKKHINVQLANLTTGSTGLNISSLDISTSSNAQTALNVLPQVERSTKLKIDNFEMLKPRFQEAVKTDATITSVDLNENIFVVKKEGNN